MTRPIAGARRSWTYAFALLACYGVTACGSDATSPKQTALTQQEAITVASSMFVEISKALASSGFAPDVSANVTAAALHTAVPITATTNVNANCTSGGTIRGSYTFTEDVATNGAGTASGTMSVTANGCKVSAGTRIIAVDGQLTYTFDMTLAPNVALDSFNWRGTGSFSWSGGSCTMDYTLKYTGTGTAKSTLTGTICGVTLG